MHLKLNVTLQINYTSTQREKERRKKEKQETEKRKEGSMYLKSQNRPRPVLEHLHEYTDMFECEVEMSCTGN